MGEEREVLTAIDLMGELILDKRQLTFKANQDVGSITEVTVLKVMGPNKIRDLYRSICEIPENRAKSNWKWRKKLKMNGEIFGKFKN